MNQTPYKVSTMDSEAMEPLAPLGNNQHENSWFYTLIRSAVLYNFISLQHQITKQLSTQPPT